MTLYPTPLRKGLYGAVLALVYEIANTSFKLSCPTLAYIDRCTEYCVIELSLTLVNTTGWLT